MYYALRISTQSANVDYQPRRNQPAGNAYRPADCEKPFAEGVSNGVAGAVYAVPITAKGDAYSMKEKKIVVELQNIGISFDGDVILDDLNLEIEDGEFVTLLGPSGCGKTTTLRIIGGFTQPDTGEVVIDGKKMNGAPPYKRQVNTIFQRYALFPHLNVYENVAFGLRVFKGNRTACYRNA